MTYAYKQGKLSANKIRAGIRNEIRKAAKEMTYKQIRDYFTIKRSVKKDEKNKKKNKKTSRKRSSK